MDERKPYVSLEMKITAFDTDDVVIVSGSRDDSNTDFYNINTNSSQGR